MKNRRKNNRFPATQHDKPTGQLSCRNVCLMHHSENGSNDPKSVHEKPDPSRSPRPVRYRVGPWPGRRCCTTATSRRGPASRPWWRPVRAPALCPPPGRRTPSAGGFGPRGRATSESEKREAGGTPNHPLTQPSFPSNFVYDCCPTKDLIRRIGLSQLKPNWGAGAGKVFFDFRSSSRFSHALGRCFLTFELEALF